MMATLGARLLEEAPRVGETATAVTMRHAGEHATLRTIAQTVEAGLSQSLRWFAWWVGTEKTPADVGASIELNKDFLNVRMSAEDMKALMLMWQTDGISFETLHYNLTQGEAMRPGVLCLLMAAGLLASASVLAQEADSQEHLRNDRLRERCEAEPGTNDFTSCLFYVSGYREGTVFAALRAEALFVILIRPGRLLDDEIRPGRVLDDDPKGLAEKYVQGFCAPTEVTMGQLVKVFVKWANDHPERHHERWNVGLHEVLELAHLAG